MSIRFAKILILFVCILVLVSCDKKQGAIDHLEDFTDELKTENSNYTSQDWNTAATEFESIQKELQQYKYTDEELKEIGRLEGICYAYFTKAEMKAFGEKIRGISKELEGGIHGFVETLSNEDNEKRSTDN
jgi:Sec-independent protein translocase protein TatA